MLVFTATISVRSCCSRQVWRTPVDANFRCRSRPPSRMSLRVLNCCWRFWSDVALRLKPFLWFCYVHVIVITSIWTRFASPGLYVMCRTCLIILTFCVDGSMGQPHGVPGKYLKKTHPKIKSGDVDLSLHGNADLDLAIGSSNVGRVEKQICNTDSVLQVTTHIAGSICSWSDILVDE